jgi:hypothetical protein
LARRVFKAYSSAIGEAVQYNWLLKSFEGMADTLMTYDSTLMIAAQGQRWEKTALAAALVLVWALVALMPLSLMMVSHMVPLPAPERPDSTANLQSATFSALAATNQQASPGHGWKMIHVLVAGCPCSSFTAQSLAARKPSTECQETVFILGDRPDWQQTLLQSGFDVQPKDVDQLVKDTGIQGGPWLLLISPEGKIVYSGGYAAQRPRPGIILQDMNILHAALAGQRPPPYPAFGCAATPLLQGQLDPLGVCQNIK